MTYRQWLFRHRFEAALLAVAAVLLIAAAFYRGWISPPSWVASTSADIEAKSPVKAEGLPAPLASAVASAAAYAKDAGLSAASAQRSEFSAGVSRDVATKAAQSASASATRAESATKKATKTYAKAAGAERARKSPPRAEPARAAVAEPAAVEPGASGGFRWVHFGVAPYASSREEAMGKRMSAFRSMGLPEPVVTQLLLATDMPAERARIAPGDHLDVMLSKGGAAHRNVTVAFTAPVRGMEYVAPAEKWSVTWGGRTYTVLLPEVCNNWSVVIGSAPLVPLQATAPSAAAPAPAPQPKFASGPCPNGWSITANAWSLADMPGDLRREAIDLIGEARVRDSQEARLLEPYKPSAFSRTLGPKLKRSMIQAPVDADIQVRYIDPVTAEPVQSLGTLHVRNGTGTLMLSDDPRQGRVLEMIWPSEFVSPVVSGGLRRLRVFPYEWKWCSPSAEGAVR